jgi:outer membrane protein OmpA-like peptidoglycan-associated protein
MVIPQELLNAKIEPYVEEPDEVIPVKPEPKIEPKVVVVVQPAVVTEPDGTKVATIQGQKVRKGGAISLQGINFKTNSDEFTSYQGVEQLLKFMLENPTVEIELSGHSDRDPFPNEDNAEAIKQQYLDLSQRRVDAVALFLEGGGVEKSRLTTKAYGGSKPLVAAKYSEKNRRVELRITKIE